MADPREQLRNCRAQNVALEARAEKAERERKLYHDALIARHGGEPVALLEELDEARERIERLEAALRKIAAAAHEGRLSPGWAEDAINRVRFVSAPWQDGTWEEAKRDA